MIKIAIVEDEKIQADNFIKYLNRFAIENDLKFSVTHFPNGARFLKTYRRQFDLVFMDIELPEMNGMEVSAKLREMDTDVIIIFVTNLAQYAVKGYEVDALDFVVKPVTYPVMALKVQRAVDRITRTVKRDSREISVKEGDYIRTIKHGNVKYVEILGHKIVFHTTEGVFKSYGTLKKLEEEFKDSNFQRCNSCYLVNLKFVSSVVGHSVFVDGEELQISQPRRKAFVRALNAYMCAED